MPVYKYWPVEPFLLLIAGMFHHRFYCLCFVFKGCYWPFIYASLLATAKTRNGTGRSDGTL